MCHLRTVIVTAAVYRGLASLLRAEALTTPRNLPAPGDVSPYTSSFDLAEACVFGKQSVGPVTAAPRAPPASGFTLPGRPFSRSYGTILPSSLTRVSSLTLVFSTCPPVLVLGTGTNVLPRGFLGGMGTGTGRRSSQLASRSLQAP